MQLYPYQEAAVARIERERKVLLNFEMGLGKTPTAISAAKRTGSTRILIVCPAIVRQVWFEELERWWPECPTRYLASSTKKMRAVPFEEDHILITSYALLHQLPEQVNYDAIIFDESHYLKGSHNKPATRQPRRLVAARRVVRTNKDRQSALLLMLTGTPIDNEPLDVWAQADLLKKGQFGSKFGFKKRYCNEVISEYSLTGYTYEGLNPERADELRQRLDRICIRVTKKEVAHLLPPLTVTPYRVPASRKDLKSLLEQLSRHDVHNTKIPPSLIRAHTDVKLKTVAELVTEARETGVTHIAVLTHLRQTAEDLAGILGGVCIHGEDTTQKRHQKLDAIQSSSGGVLVATMHSLTTGLSLTAFTEVIFAELYWRPSTVSQALARYHRVSGKEPVNVKMVIVEGTVEEQIAARVQQRLEDSAKLIEAGNVESDLHGALEEDDEDFFAGLRRAANAMEHEAYL